MSLQTSLICCASKDLRYSQSGKGVSIRAEEEKTRTKDDLAAVQHTYDLVPWSPVRPDLEQL